MQHPPLRRLIVTDVFMTVVGLGFLAGGLSDGLGWLGLGYGLFFTSAGLWNLFRLYRHRWNQSPLTGPTGETSAIQPQS